MELEMQTATVRRGVPPQAAVAPGRALGDFGGDAAFAAVRAELAGAYDGWRLAAWFTEPNAWLDDALPIDRMDSDLAAVVQAARADRFVATG